MVKERDVTRPTNSDIGKRTGLLGPQKPRKIMPSICSKQIMFRGISQILVVESSSAGKRNCGLIWNTNQGKSINKTLIILNNTGRHSKSCMWCFNCFIYSFACWLREKYSKNSITSRFFVNRDFIIISVLF